MYLEILVTQSSLLTESGYQISNDGYVLSQLYVECEKLLVQEQIRAQQAGNTEEKILAVPEKELDKCLMILRSIKHILSNRVNKEVSSSVVLLVLHLI